VKAKPQMYLARAKGATVVLDGDHGFGQVIGAEGMGRAVGLARVYGGGCAGFETAPISAPWHTLRPWRSRNR
jgi:LDH2 family malate/lactate/ureidoglycolate dehydrogenase